MHCSKARIARWPPMRRSRTGGFVFGCSGPIRNTFSPAPVFTRTRFPPVALKNAAICELQQLVLPVQIQFAENALITLYPAAVTSLSTPSIAGLSAHLGEVFFQRVPSDESSASYASLQGLNSL